MGINYKYDAFISYRHVSPDKEIAEKLQKKLENYKPPKSLCKEKKFGGWRVFRDETELPTSSNLSNDIRTALEESKFLIVICSKTTKDSRWCMEEIEYFKELHKGNNANIITLVADGDPEDVFPVMLCNELIPVTDENGVTTYQNHVIEPLAANVSADSSRESLKKLNTEFLRIAAPILGCGYDNLYNREHKKKIRRLFTIGSIVIAFLLLFGLYNSAMLWQINNQKIALAAANEDLQKKTEELNQSNQELQQSNKDLALKTKEAEDNLAEANKQKQAAEANLTEAEKQRKIAEDNLAEANRQKKIAEDNLAEANRQQAIAEANAQEANTQRGIAEENMRIAQENEAVANEQTRLAQIENSENLSTLSENLWNSGDGIAAIQTALSALPDENSQRPVVSSTLRVLANEIGAFEQESFSAVDKLICEDHVNKIGYAGNGATLVSQDSTGVYLWNTATGDLIKKYQNDDFGNNNSSINVYFDNTGKYVSLGAYKHAVGIYVRNEHHYLEGWKKQNTDEKSLSNTDILIQASNSFYKIDGTSGEIIWEIDEENSYSSYSDVSTTKIIISKKVYGEDYKATGINIKVFDRENGHLLNDLTLSDPNLKLSAWTNWIDVTKDKAYYHNDSSLDEGKIIAFDIEKEQLVNPQIIYESSNDPLYLEYDYTHFDTVQIINDNIYIVKTHWDAAEYTFITELIVTDNSGQRKWSYSYENNFTHGNHVRIELFTSATCKNFCDILCLAKGNKVVLLNYETGENIFTYEFDSLIKESYCSDDGFLVVMTEDGYEVAIAARNIEKGVVGDSNYPMVQLHKFMSQHSLYAYFNRQYAVSNGNSNEIYLYSDVKNDDYKKLLTDEDSIDKVLINNSQTYIAINSYKEVYIYDVGAQKTYELIKSEEYLRDALFMSDYLYVVIDNEKNINIFDLRTKELVYKKNCENISSFTGSTYSYAYSVGGHLIFKENYSDFAILNDRYEINYWKPQKSSTLEYREWNEGNISEVYCSDETDKILAVVRYGYDTGNLLEIYDINTGESIPLDVNLTDSNENTLSIKSVAWAKDELFVAFSDNIVRKFDTITGKCNSEIKYNVPPIVSVVDLNDSTFIALLCNDSKLYKVNSTNGIIIDSLALDNYYVKTTSLDRTITEIIPQQNKLILSGWNEEFGVNHAYIIDLETFDVCYDVDGYAGFLPSQNRLLVENYNIVGSYPLYTMDELIEKAKKNIAE